MSLEWREALWQANVSRGVSRCDENSILYLRRHPRRAIHSHRYHVKMNRQRKYEPNSRNILRLCRKPARELLHKVARRGICSVTAQVQAADHATMTIARRAIKSSLAE